LQEVVKKRFDRMRKAINLQRPDQMPCSDISYVEYRPEVYHLGRPEFPVKPGEVGISSDGKKKYTADGGVWAVGDPEKYRDFMDVLNISLETFEVEEVNQKMLEEMKRLFIAGSKTHFPVPWHYGTLVTRATIEFGWEPFLMASVIDPAKFGKVLDRFGEASLAVIQGWLEIPDVELIGVHDDIAATKDVFMEPKWYREYVFPWYKRIFAEIHHKDKKVIYVCDGNYMSVLDDIMATETDGFYIETSSMEPETFMRVAGRDKIFLIKTNSRNIDFGTPEDIYQELRKLRELHGEFPGMMIYIGGGKPVPGNVEAFNKYYQELLVYQ